MGDRVNDKKMVLGMFLVMASILLVLSGCGEDQPPQRTSAAPQREPQTYQEVIEETERQMEDHAEEMGVEPKGDEGGTAKSCVVLQQCGGGDDLCWQGRCWTEAQLFEDYEKCQDMRCNHLECPECESGHEQCTIATSAGSSMYRVCVDCVRGTGCKPGFDCKMGRCV